MMLILIAIFKELDWIFWDIYIYLIQNWLSNFNLSHLNWPLQGTASSFSISNLDSFSYCINNIIYKETVIKKADD